MKIWRGALNLLVNPEIILVKLGNIQEQKFKKKLPKKLEFKK